MFKNMSLMLKKQITNIYFIRALISIVLASDLSSVRSFCSSTIFTDANVLSSLGERQTEEKTSAMKSGGTVFDPQRSQNWVNFLFLFSPHLDHKMSFLPQQEIKPPRSAKTLRTEIYKREVAKIKCCYRFLLDY